MTTLYISDGLMHQLDRYVELNKGREIAGLGIIELDADNELVLQSVYTVKHSVMEIGEADLLQDAVAKLTHRLRTEGKDITQLKFWWHVHPIEGWSRRDEKTINKERNNGEWGVAMVKTPKAGWIARLDTYKPRLTGELEYVIYHEASPELEKQYKQDVKDAQPDPPSTIVIPPRPDWNGRDRLGVPLDFGTGEIQVPVRKVREGG